MSKFWSAGITKSGNYHFSYVLWSTLSLISFGLFEYASRSGDAGIVLVILFYPLLVIGIPSFPAAIISGILYARKATDGKKKLTAWAMIAVLTAIFVLVYIRQIFFPPQ